MLQALLVSTLLITQVPDLEAGVQTTLNHLTPPVSGLVGGGLYTTANTHGNLPHFDIGIGVNVIPKIEVPKPTDTTETFTFPGLFGSLNLEVGLFGGMPILPTIGGVGSVDLLLRFTPAPPVSSDYVKEVPKYTAFGAKIGFLRESLTTPAISATVLFSRFGDLVLGFDHPTGDSVFVQMGLRVTSLHFDISKNLLLFTPYAGLGFDWYSLDAGYKEAPTLAEGAYTSLASQSGRQTRIYGGIETKLFLLKLYLEAGKYGDQVMFSAGLKGGI